MARMRNVGCTRRITFLRKRWPIASIARARPLIAMSGLGLLPKPQAIGNLQRWDFEQVKAFIKVQNAAAHEKLKASIR